MLLKIISLGLIFLVDYSFGSCGLCLKNHVACHSENMFSLCVEGKPTNSYVRCPEDSICTDAPAICTRKYSDELKPSCTRGKVPEEMGNLYKAQNSAWSKSSKLTEVSMERAVSDEEAEPTADNPSEPTERQEGDESVIDEETTSNPSSTEPQDDKISPSTQNSDTNTLDPLVTEATESSTTDNREDESATYPSTDTTVMDEEVTLITEDLFTTETTESSDLSTSSSQDVSSGDFSTTDIDLTSSTITPRDASTFCSENKVVGTFKAEGDTTGKRYYVCTTYKDGFKGFEFNCGKKFYFNPETSLCQKEKPEDF